ncbi:MAG: tripartite tricarboxylate transporter TctB family protein [Deltaproteobacteria bacterium]|nr:tripartite tricarboxylate transporter TctB family protein [Deltaproteobacteria bacterium]
MKITGRTGMGIALMLISGGVFGAALQWPLKTAIFPMTIAAFTFGLAAIEVFLGLFLKQTAKETSTMDFKMAGAEDADIDAATVRKRVLMISLWMALFFFLILLAGFPVAVPIFFVVFLRTYGKEGWKMTIILAAVAWVSFYGLFIRMLHIPFADGWIVQWLRAAGILG